MYPLQLFCFTFQTCFLYMYIQNKILLFLKSYLNDMGLTDVERIEDHKKSVKIPLNEIGRNS